MPSYPLPTLAAQVTDTGISAPSYADVLASLKASFRSIYGADAYLEADSQDGQWVAILAAAVNDCNAATVAAYNAFSPATAKGVGLSSVVKINGLQRHLTSASTATVTIVGQAFATITNGKVRDAAGRNWSLPASVTIEVDGSVDVTATCDTQGAITAAAGSLTVIATPTLGWQSVTNALAATPGAPVEADAKLRQRQAQSTALPAQTPLQAIVAAVELLTGVTLVKPYENNTSVTDANGIPPWSLALVVLGGSDADVGQAILNKKMPGGPTYGSTTVTVNDPYGVPKAIKFSRPGLIQIAVEVTIHPLLGYTSIVGDEIRQAVVDYINGFKIGDSVYRSRLYLPANLFGAAASASYEVTGLRLCISGGSLGTADIAVLFNQLAQAVLSDVSLITV